MHRKYYTSAQEHLRKGLKPICNEADLSKFLSHLQEAVFGSKGMPCNTSRKYSVRLSVRQDSGRLSGRKNRAMCGVMVTACLPS